MTNAELAILSLLVERPRHGYEIEQVIQERGMREWTEVGFSSIYYLLKKLESAELVHGQLKEQTGRGPARKVYDVTNAGRKAWHEAAVELLSTPTRRTMPFLMGLANLPELDVTESVTAVRRYRDKLAEQRDHVRTRAREEGQAALHVKAMFDLSLTLIEAELAWIEGFIAELEVSQVRGAKRTKEM